MDHGSHAHQSGQDGPRSGKHSQHGQQQPRSRTTTSATGRQSCPGRLSSSKRHSRRHFDYIGSKSFSRIVPRQQEGPAAAGNRAQPKPSNRNSASGDAARGDENRAKHHHHLHLLLVQRQLNRPCCANWFGKLPPSAARAENGSEEKVAE